MFEPFLVHAALTYTLAYLRECSDKACLDAIIHKSQAALAVLHRRIAEGTLSPEVGEAMIGHLEEHINNLHADVELARKRYEKFCEKVVKEECCREAANQKDNALRTSPPAPVSLQEVHFLKGGTPCPPTTSKIRRFFRADEQTTAGIPV